MGCVAWPTGKTILAGSQRLLAGEGVATGSLDGDLDLLAGAGKSAVLVAVDGRLLGGVALADTLKDGAIEVVARLKQMGLQTVMISGDRRPAALAVARQLGIDTVEAEVLPADKLVVVRSYQQRGKFVGMVGDGINDAPALAQADIGIAIGSGTDVAKETGDIILVRDDLLDVVRSIELGRRTLAKIRQNLFWAFIYNIVGIPVAAGLLYPAFGLVLKPEFAGLAMAFSSVLGGDQQPAAEAAVPEVDMTLDLTRSALFRPASSSGCVVNHQFSSSLTIIPTLMRWRPHTPCGTCS